MKDFLGIFFEGDNEAEIVRLGLNKLKRPELAELDAAAVVRCNADRTLSLNCALSQEESGTFRKSALSQVLELLLLEVTLAKKNSSKSQVARKPLVKAGIEGHFIEQFSSEFMPNSSALCLMSEGSATSSVMSELAPFEGRVVMTSFDPVQLQAVVRTLSTLSESLQGIPLARQDSGCLENGHIQNDAVAGLLSPSK